jgi:hypothetical protein
MNAFVTQQMKEKRFYAFKRLFRTEYSLKAEVLCDILA